MTRTLALMCFSITVENGILDERTFGCHVPAPSGAYGSGHVARVW